MRLLFARLSLILVFLNLTVISPLPHLERGAAFDGTLTAGLVDPGGTDVSDGASSLGRSWDRTWDALSLVHVGTPALAANGAPSIPPGAPATAVGVIGQTAASALADLGVWDGKTPFNVVCAGQSNSVSQDHNGPHNEPANTFVIDNIFNPTGFVPATYGQPPFNYGYSGTQNGGQATVAAALTYVNQCKAFAYYLRQANVIPAARPINIYRDHASAQSASDWVDRVPLDMWTPFLSQLAIGTAQAPASIINWWMWDQGENDNNVAATFTGGQSGTVMTVTGTPTGTLAVNQPVQGGPVPEYIVSLGTGTGGAGTYNMSQSATIGANTSLTSGPYGTKALYSAAWDRLYTQMSSLPQWTAQSRGAVVELGPWASNSAQNRNDFLRTMRGGANGKYPQMTFISGAGGAESPDNPIPHYTGYWQDQIGLRAFQAFMQMHLLGTDYMPGAANGSAQAYPNQITIGNQDAYTADVNVTIANPYVLNVTATTGATIQVGDVVIGSTVATTGFTRITTQLTGTPGGVGTYSLSCPGGCSQTINSQTFTGGPALGPDDIRAGAQVNVASTTASVFSMPNAAAASGPIFVSTKQAAATTNVYSSGPMAQENIGTTTTGLNMALNPGILFVATPINGTWYFDSLDPRVGNTRWSTGSSAFPSGSTQTLISNQLNHKHYSMIGGVTVNLTPTFGNDACFYGLIGGADNTLNVSAGTFFLPDQTTPTALTVKAGQEACVHWGVGPSNALQGIVSIVNNAPSTQYAAPATGATVTVPTGYDTVNEMIDPAGTIAALTIALPASPRNGQEVNLSTTQTITAVTYTGGTVATGAAPSGLPQGTHLPLTFNTAQGKWY